jgi:hypothetical protein
MYYNQPSEERSLTYGLNPMCETFPRIAACNYVRYGGGGMQENRSAICILGLNMINDKVHLYFFGKRGCPDGNFLKKTLEFSPLHHRFGS